MDIHNSDKTNDLGSSSIATPDSGINTNINNPNPNPKPAIHSDLKLYSSTKHLLDCQTPSQKKILLRAELLQKLQEKINPCFHEKIRHAIALTYKDQCLVLMISNPALAAKIKIQQAQLNQLVSSELHAFLEAYLAAKKQLHLLPELLEQLLPEGKINLLIRPFYKER